MKIVLLDGYSINPDGLDLSMFNKIGEFYFYDHTDYCDVVERAKDAEVILTNRVTFDELLFSQLPKLKYIGTTSTGYNHIDINIANKYGVVVTNVPSYSTHTVAAFTFALMLEISYNVGEHARMLKEFGHAASFDVGIKKFPLMELANKTLGIIGFGEIGREVSKMAAAFGMNVLVYSRTKYSEYESDSLRFVSLEELLGNSDFVSLHLPLNNDTKYIINKETINKMKPRVVIINTARGGLINEKDMAEALKSKKVYALMADVVENEPFSSNSPLFNLDNVFVTPHIAWATKETRTKLIKEVYLNVLAYINREKRNIVN